MKRSKTVSIEFNVLTRIKNGGWQVVVSYKDVNGNWRQKSKQGFKSERMAMMYSSEILKEIEEQQKHQLNNEIITFKTFTDELLKRMEKTRTSNTKVAYMTALNHFADLNDKSIDEITTIDIQNDIDLLAGKKENTIKLYLACIKTVFNKAIYPYKYIYENPVKNIEYKKDKQKKKPEEKHRALTPAEFELLLSYFTSLKHRSFILVGGCCGLRRGEMLGLTWNDIDFKNNVIDINKQWKNIGKTAKKKSIDEYGFGELKTANSYRNVPLPPRVRKALLEYKKVWTFSPDGRVFPYAHPRAISNLFRYKLKNTKVNVTPHCLRHTYATTIIKAGMDFQSAAKLLGHDVEMTMKTYSHVTAEMDQNSVNLINKIFV